MARMLLNGKSRFFSVCDVNGLDVAKRSPATTSTLEAGQRLSSHRDQTRATELRKVLTLSSRACVEILFVAISVDLTALAYSFQARRPPTRMPLPLLLLQQLQCRDSGFVQSLEINHSADWYKGENPFLRLLKPVGEADAGHPQVWFVSRDWEGRSS